MTESHLSGDPIFKFFKREHLPFFLEKKVVKISSSKYFQREYLKMEVKDNRINDPHEGYVWQPQLKSITSENVTDSERQALAQFGYKPGNGSLFAHNLIVTIPPLFHMVCFTTGYLKQQWEVFCGPSALMPYDACLEIVDLTALAQSLLNNGLVLDDEGTPAMPLHRIFDSATPAPVVYEKTSYAWDTPAPDPSPFRKDTSFSDQKEFRLVLHRNPSGLYPDRPAKDVLLVHVPDLEKYISEVDVSGFRLD